MSHSKQLDLVIRDAENGYIISTQNSQYMSLAGRIYVARTIDELKKIVGTLALMAQIPDAPEEAKKAR